MNFHDVDKPTTELQSSLRAIGIVDQAAAVSFETNGLALVQSVDSGAVAQGRPSLIDLHRQHHALMSLILRASDYDLLWTTTLFAYRASAAIGHSYDDLLFFQQLWRRCVVSVLGREHVRSIAQVYDWQIEHHDRLIAASRSNTETNGEALPPLDAIGTEVLGQLLTGNEREVLRLTRVSVDGPDSLATFYLSVLTPVMYTIGAMWEKREITVDQEHLATSIASRVVSVLFSLVSTRTPDKPLLVMTCAPGEEHSFGARLAADLLELAGWDVEFLGANAPVGDLFSYIAQRCPFVVAISISMIYNAHGVLRLLESIADMPEETRPRILVGGRAVEQFPRVFEPVKQFGAVAVTIDQAFQQADLWLSEHPDIFRLHRDQIQVGTDQDTPVARPEASLATVTRLNEELARALRAPQKDRTRLQSVLEQQTLVERELRINQEVTRTLLDGSQDGLALIDAQSRILEINAAFAQEFGLTRTELVVRTIPEILPEFPQITDMVSESLQAGESRDGTFPAASRFFDIRVFPVKTSSDAVEMAGLVVRDISRERRAEQLLVFSSRLETAETLASGAAHDFNNLLAAIHGQAEYLEIVDLTSERARATVTGIKKAAMRGAEVAHRMLDFATGGTGHFEAVVVDLVVEESMGRYKHHLDERITIESSLKLGELIIHSDRHQLSSIVTHLLRNAEEAIDDRGHFSVSTSLHCHIDDSRRPCAELVSGRYAVISIRDNGSGMDEETVARAHEPFFSTKVLGRGLGLSAVYGIARAHDGCIEIDSRPGEGTQVDVYLKVTETHTDTEE